jgi:hypothetical protein
MCWSRRREPWRPPAGSSSALENSPHPIEVTTDRAPSYPRVIEELIPAAVSATHRPQPGLQAPLIGFNEVILILLGDQRLGQF